MSSLELALNKLCKWRTVFAGWQLGTRTKDDPESQAVRDHREVTMLLRAEVSALTSLLIQKGVIQQEEWYNELEKEAERLDKDYERKFPGCRTSQMGVHIDLQVAENWLKNWRP